MTEKLLSAEIADQVKDVFAQLDKPVKVIFFGKQKDCEYCADTLQLIQEVADLSHKVELDIVDVDINPGVAVQYKMDKTPGLVIAALEGDQVIDYGIRFAGIPSGHEFSSLIQDLLLVSGRDSGLGEKTKKFLGELNQPVLLQVFVTPTCPYCPRAVVLAHQMALESPWVEAEMVEAIEFPELSDRFGVSGVPQTTINSGKGTVVGAVPEDHLVAEIRAALNRA